MHAIVAQILLDWCATATGQTRSDVIQRLALLNAWLDDKPSRFPKAPQTGLPNQSSPPHPRPRRLTRAGLPNSPVVTGLLPTPALPSHRRGRRGGAAIRHALLSERTHRDSGPDRR